MSDTDEIAIQLVPLDTMIMMLALLDGASAVIGAVDMNDQTPEWQDYAIQWFTGYFALVSVLTGSNPLGGDDDEEPAATEVPY